MSDPQMKSTGRDYTMTVTWLVLAVIAAPAVVLGLHPSVLSVSLGSVCSVLAAGMSSGSLGRSPPSSPSLPSPPLSHQRSEQYGRHQSRPNQRPNQWGYFQKERRNAIRSHRIHSGNGYRCSHLRALTRRENGASFIVRADLALVRSYGIHVQNSSCSAVACSMSATRQMKPHLYLRRREDARLRNHVCRVT